MVEARLRPQGPYSLKLTTWTDDWSAQLPEGRWAAARQAVRTLRGLRTKRLATVAQAAVHAICGQLIQSRRAREIERAVTRACGETPPSREALARLSPARLTACGLAQTRAATLARVVRTIDLEGLRATPDTALRRLGRERGIGPWSVGVIALSGLGRYDTGLVGDLGLVKLLASRTGRWPDPSETAGLLEPYGDWQGLASVFLLAGFKRGLVPGANRDRARLARARCPVALYARLPALGEPELIHDAVPAGAAILELGAGAGRITHALVALGHPVVAVDNSAEMLDLVQGAETVQADIETLDLRRRFPVVVLASNFVNHLDASERRELLACCARHWEPRTEWSELGDVRLRLRSYALDGAVVTGEMEYVVEGEHLVHSFESRLLDDEELDADLRAAGLRRLRELDERGSWIEAVPTGS